MTLGSRGTRDFLTIKIHFIIGRALVRMLLYSIFVDYCIEVHIYNYGQYFENIFTLYNPQFLVTEVPISTSFFHSIENIDTPSAI